VDRIFPKNFRGEPGSALHLFYKVLRKLPEEFAAWFSLDAGGEDIPQLFLVWRERHGFLIQVAPTSQRFVEAALHGDLFGGDETVGPGDLGRGENEVLERFVSRASEEFGPLAGELPVKKLVVFPNVAESTIDEVLLLRGEQGTTYLGMQQMDAGRFERRLAALAEAALPATGMIHLRRLFTPESVVPDDFQARRTADRNTAAATRFLDFDQEWCVKNDLDLLPAQDDLVHEASARTRLVTGVAGSGKSLVILYRALLSAKLHPRARVLVLTHNRPLRNELERRCGRLEGTARNLEWSTFFQWAVRSIGGIQGDIWSPARTRSALIELRSGLPSLDPLSPDYLTDEIGWIKDHRLLTRDAYRAADRSGRGTRLTARQRDELWDLLSRYQHLLHAQRANDWHGVALAFHRAAVEEGRLGFPRYDAIFIDEAQFFAKCWFEIVRAALKPGGHLFLAADPTQGFLRRRQSWIAAGIEVRGRTTRLTQPYRNARAILAFAREFYESRRSGEDAEEGLNVPDDTVLESISEVGEAPEIIRVDTTQDEIARAVNEVEALREGGLVAGSLLLLHADSRLEWALRAALEAKLGIGQVHDLKDGPMPATAYCAVTTLNAATGLEAPVVILLGVDALLESENDPRLSEEERTELRRDHTRQLYMGFTRAGQRLLVIRTAGRSDNDEADSGRIFPLSPGRPA
jgi:hypothetical protein